MNDKKLHLSFAQITTFIMKNDVRYINELVIPTGYLIDIIAIKDADNILCGYNAGMASCDGQIQGVSSPGHFHPLSKFFKRHHKYF